MPAQTHAERVLIGSTTGKQRQFAVNTMTEQQLSAAFPGQEGDQTRRAGTVLGVATPRPKTMSARLSRLGLRLLGGWEFEGELPAEKSSVMLAVPHSSNLDGLLLVLLTRSVGLRSNWMVKDLWTKAPMGWLTKRVGAVGVNRSKASGMVDQMVEQFAQRDDFHLMVPPEGTRSLAEHWRSGFYQIALKANVPVTTSNLDYRNKRAWVGPGYLLTGDKRVDMDYFREVYAEGAEMARYPENVGPIGLRDED